MEYEARLHQFLPEELHPSVRYIPFEEWPTEKVEHLLSVQKEMPLEIQNTELRDNPVYIR